MGLVRNRVFVSLRGWFWRFTVPPLNIASLSWCVHFVSLFLLVTKIRVWPKHRLRMLSNDRFWACFWWHVFSQPWRRCDFFSHGTLVGWGGVGWANNVHFLVHTDVMLRYCTFSCTCTHTSWNAAVRSLARAHLHHAMLLYGTVRLLAHAHLRHALYVFLHVHTYVMLCHDPSSLALALALALAHTHTRTWCYVVISSLAL